ncbi:MAG: endonuclease V [Candidatus Dormiibacterota bacterium]
MQRQLALLDHAQSRWTHGDLLDISVGAVFATGPRGIVGAGEAGDPAWAAAVVVRGGAQLASVAVTGWFGARYRPGLLALREGPLLERTVRTLRMRPDVLLVDATGRDHPRGAGLAIHLGWVLGMPTIGVTDRHLHDPSASTPIPIRPGVRPVLVHPGWRTDPETAAAVVRPLLVVRTPAPLREARRLARTARSGPPHP